MKEKGFFSIGEVAAALDITPCALRHYEKKGLIAPSRIDKNSGYRYYSALDLQDIMLVKILRGAGLTIESIHAYINKGIMPQAQLESLQLAVDKIKAHCTVKGKYHAERTKLPQRICCCRSFTVSDIASFIPLYHVQVGEIIRKMRAVLSGAYPVFCEYPTGAFLKDNLNMKDFPAKICVPIKEGTSKTDTETYPEQDAVSVNFRGAYEDLWQGYKAAYAYMAQHALTQDAAPQEIYFESVNTALAKDEYLTRIIIPVRRGNQPCRNKLA